MSLIERFLFVQALDLFIHGIDQQILFLFRLFEIHYILLSTVGGASCDRDLALHHFVVFFYLFESAVQLIQLFLGLEHTFQLLIGLFFAAFVLSLLNFKLFFGIDTVLLDDVVVVVSAFEGGLHLGQLMLDSVKLHTDLLSLFLDFSDLFLLLPQFQVNTLVLIC